MRFQPAFVRDRLCIMNTYSPNVVANTLGVSRRRVVAAAGRARLGTTAGSRLTFSEGDVDVLRTLLGCSSSATGLSRSESLVLAELARRPRGLNSARAVARACGMSAATASKAVKSLVASGLVVAKDEVRPLGRATRVRVLYANTRHPHWSALLTSLRAVAAPRVDQPKPTDPVPRDVAHAFWNVSPQVFACLTPARDGAFIASRALTTADPELLAYAAAVVTPEQWRRASAVRGLSDRDRALASNLGMRVDERATG